MGRTKVVVDLRADPVPPQLDLEAAIAASWSEDPGHGKAVIAEDGREICSPLQFEEPADIEPAQDMMMIMERRIVEKIMRARAVV